MNSVFYVCMLHALPIITFNIWWKYRLEACHYVIPSFYHYLIWFWSNPVLCQFCKASAFIFHGVLSVSSSSDYLNFVRNLCPCLDWLYELSYLNSEYGKLTWSLSRATLRLYRVLSISDSTSLFCSSSTLRPRSSADICKILCKYESQDNKTFCVSTFWQWHFTVHNWYHDLKNNFW